MTPNQRSFLTAVRSNPGSPRPSHRAETMLACQRKGLAHTPDGDLPYSARTWVILPAGVAALREVGV